MKKLKRVIPVMMAAALTFAGLPMVAKADSSKVVTLGANLSEEQKNSMYQYFGTSADQVETIEVTNADERKYMEGIASEAQIGTRTYSCSYVEPTSSGGVQVKVANLTYVTSSMIASTLLTSGVENCNVVAGSPIAVSGTGALTGIMMAYESASGKELSEEQKAAATEELVTTGELADSIGQEDAADLMNGVKQEVIEDGLKEDGEIEDAIKKAADDKDVTLTAEQMAKIAALMKNISQYDYDVKALKNTLDNLDGKSDGFFSNLWGSIKGFFTGESSDGGILNETDDKALGADAVVESTKDGLISGEEDEEKEGLWDKITGFFKGIFGGDDEKKEEDKDKTEDVDDKDKEEVPEDEDIDENADPNADTENGGDVNGVNGEEDGTGTGEGQDAINGQENPEGQDDGNADDALNKADQQNGSEQIQ